MPGYTPGTALTTMRSAVIQNTILRDRVSNLERINAELIYQLKVKNGLIKNSPEPHVPYIDTLTEEQRHTKPTLKYGDTPHVCELRLAALQNIKPRKEATR